MVTPGYPNLPNYARRRAESAPVQPTDSLMCPLAQPISFLGSAHRYAEMCRNVGRVSPEIVSSQASHSAFESHPAPRFLRTPNPTTHSTGNPKRKAAQTLALPSANESTKAYDDPRGTDPPLHASTESCRTPTARIPRAPGHEQCH